MATINSGPQGGPQQSPGQSAQTAQQGASNARDAAPSAVNNGLQGVLATINAMRTLMDKQLASTATQQKLSVQWNGSLKTMSESASQTNKALAASADAVKSETTVRKQSTEASGKELRARRDAQTILEKEATQRKKQLVDDALKNRLDIIQTAKLSAVMKQSRDIMSERSKLEQELMKNEQELVAAKTKQAVKHLADERQVIQSNLTQNTKLFEAAREAQSKHTGGIVSAGDAIAKFKSKLQDFATGAAFGNAVRKLYEEAQSAKTTGNYATNMQFLQGQANAGAMGVGSQVYNDIVANARAAQLTTASFAEFNNSLVSGTDKMQTLTGSREEGAKLAGEMYKNAGLVGITMADMGSRMDVLGDTFGRLTKLTGKTSAEMAQLSMSIMTDNDHRGVMLGMQSAERGEYIQKRMQDLELLKLQGFSIEQAQELQKMAMRARTQGLAEHIGKDAKASAQAAVMANMLGGSAGAKITTTQQQIQALTQEANAGVTDERAGEIEQEKARLRTQIITAVNEGRKNKTMGAERYILNERLREFEGNTDVTERNAAYETGSTEAQKRSKRGEGNIGGKGSVLDTATTAAGYVTALGNNTLALNLLTGVMVSGRAFDLGKAALQSGKIGSLIGNAKSATMAASEISGGGALARGAAGGGYALDAMKASKLIKGVSLLAPIAGAVEGYSNYDASKHNLGESVGLGVGSAAGSLAGGWGGAAAGAALGTMLLPGIGTIVGGALGGLGGGLGGDWLGGKAGKALGSMTDSSPAEKAKADVEAAIHPELAKSEQERAALTDLQKQYYTAGIEFYKNSDPKTDQEARAKHAAVIQRLATSAQLTGASFATAATQTGS